MKLLPGIPGSLKQDNDSVQLLLSAESADDCQDDGGQGAETRLHHVCLREMKMMHF